MHMSFIEEIREDYELYCQHLETANRLFKEEPLSEQGRLHLLAATDIRTRAFDALWFEAELAERSLAERRDTHQ